MKCIFCKQETENRNNSEPLSKKPCCNYCNMRFVVPVRMAESKGRKPKVRLTYMEGEPQMEAGLTGSLDMVDDIGQIHVNWENGSTLALNAEVDIFSIY